MLYEVMKNWKTWILIFLLTLSFTKILNFEHLGREIQVDGARGHFSEALGDLSTPIAVDETRYNLKLYVLKQLLRWV